MTRQTSNKRRAISPDSPRKKMKDKRRVQLIEANITSIAKHGLSETTISHVSEAAGMSRGIINFYFDSKDSMMQETLAHLLQEITEAWQTALNKASGSSSQESLEAILFACFSNTLCTRKKLSAWMAFLSHAASHANYRHQIEQGLAPLQTAFEELIAELRPESAQQTKRLSALLLAQVQGLWLSYITYQQGIDKKELVNICLLAVKQSLFSTENSEYVGLTVNANAQAPKRSTGGRPRMAPSPITKTPGNKTTPSQEEPAALGDLFADL